MTLEEGHRRIQLVFDEDGYHESTLVDGEEEPCFVTPLHVYLGIEPFNMLDPANAWRIEQIDPDRFEAASAQTTVDWLSKRRAWLVAKGIDPDVYEQVIAQQRELAGLGADDAQ